MKDNEKQLSQTDNSVSTLDQIQELSLQKENSLDKYQPFKNLLPMRAKKFRKSAYLLALIKKDNFVSFGAERLNDDLYILSRPYDGSVSGETCGILGVGKKLLKQLLERESSVYTILKSCPLLETCKGIETLSPYSLEPLKYLMRYLCFMKTDELLLFTIEPKAEDAAHAIHYPSANICFCGGGLERQDDMCFMKCAWREFSEETGIGIPDKYELITRQKFILPGKYAIYFIVRI